MKVEGIFVKVCGQKEVVVGEPGRRPSRNTNNCSRKCGVRVPQRPLTSDVEGVEKNLRQLQRKIEIKGGLTRLFCWVRFQLFNGNQGQ
jgi:hypothetical protein